MSGTVRMNRQPCVLKPDGVTFMFCHVFQELTFATDQKCYASNVFALAGAGRWLLDRRRMANHLRPTLRNQSSNAFAFKPV